MTDELLTISEASKFIHVTPNTLRVWERNGVIKPMRTAGGQRRYSREELYTVAGKSHRKRPRMLTVGYCRVSTADQQQDLERQAEVVKNYCEKQGYKFKIIKDIGSGINYRKQGIKELISLVCSGEAERIVVNYKDRLVRFGYDLIEQVCLSHGVEIEIINQTEGTSSEQELVQDVLEIITVFSAKLYGSRSHKNKEVIRKTKELFGGGGDHAGHKNDQG